MNTKIENTKQDPFLLKLKKLYLKSVKPVQTDELLVVAIFRPIGFLIAMVSKFLKISPNALTVVRGILGITAGVLFFMGTSRTVPLGAIILFIGTFFDVADGQLARILEKSSRFGTIIDGIGDGVTVITVYVGVMVSLIRNNPGNSIYWLVLTILGALSFLIQLNTFGFMRHEYLFYTRASNEKRDTFKEINEELKDIDKTKKEKKDQNKFLLGLLMIFNIGFIELTSKIVLLKKYTGFMNWYKKDNGISPEKKEIFKKNYSKYNGWILQLFGNLGLGSNLVVFTIAGLFNRLDMGILVILIAFNIYYLLVTIIQKVSFNIQLKKIESSN